MTATGAGEIRPGKPQLLLSSLDANVSASNLIAQGKNLGDVTLKANTSGTNRLDLTLDSNLAGASINGTGNAQLSGDYPVDAHVTFNNVLYTHLRDLLGTSGTERPAFEGALDGQVALNGPRIKTRPSTGFGSTYPGER